MKKKVVISWSSGKDSTLTLERLLESTEYEVVALYTTYVGDEVPFQVTPIDVVAMQAQLIGLPLITIELPEVFPSNEIYQSTIVLSIERVWLIQLMPWHSAICFAMVLLTTKKLYRT
eukprot:TRINITY_DN1478_c0_g1_i1.p1 TRINITY_DN1478_c0_g1~~TRINITY_DN1478_c0_g1_i1.p1  ORF type:complete len:117 (+),score=5.37 TRINITY_DN1478_c0_g1_i1:216-566(+)